MKKYAKTLLAAVAILSASACQNDTQLKKNALGYIEAMAAYDINEARQYATPETQNLTLDYIENTLLPLLDSSYITSNTPADIHIDSIVHTNDSTATVYFTKKTPINPKINANVDMHLRNGQWLAHQIIKPLPLLGGSFSAIDTASMKQNPTNRKEAPRKIIHMNQQGNIE